MVAETRSETSDKLAMLSLRRSRVCKDVIKLSEKYKEANNCAEAYAMKGII